VREKACHTLRGFVEAMIWGRSRMKNICSLSVQIHRKSCSCLSKYIECQGTFLFDLTFHP
jgi:hypothetical protein